MILRYNFERKKMVTRHHMIQLDMIDDSLSTMRLTRPEQITLMQESLKALDQLHPAVVRK